MLVSELSASLVLIGGFISPAVVDNIHYTFHGCIKFLTTSFSLLQVVICSKSAITVSVTWQRKRRNKKKETRIKKNAGKIQGDGRKFLDLFKSYFGSQISPQSLHEVHISRLQPKSATKGDFFHIFLFLIVSSWRHGLQMANEADEVLLGKRPR